MVCRGPALALGLLSDDYSSLTLNSASMTSSPLFGFAGGLARRAAVGSGVEPFLAASS